MSREGVKILMGKPTETDDVNLWEFTNSGQTAREPAWGPHRLSASGGQLCRVVFCGVLAVGPGPVPDA